MKWSYLTAAIALVTALLVGVPSTARAAEAEATHAEAEHAEGEHGAEAHGDGAHGAAAHGEPNPLVVDIDLAAWTVVVFVGLLFVLGKFAWGPIAKALDQREQGIADQIAAAQSANEEAKRLLAQYEAKLSKAAEEVRGILDEARRDAEHTQQEILAKAREDAAKEVERGKREIETATGQALKEVAEAGANLAVDLAGRIVKSKLNAQDHTRLIEEAMAAFPRGDHQKN